MTLSADIERVADSEDILAITIGEMGWTDYNDTRWHEALAHKGELLTWRKAKGLLDLSYDGGYGAPDHPSFVAWTESKVIFAGTYDGSTWVTSMPRNPVGGDVAHMPGG